jgi:hypothetical protein
VQQLVLRGDSGFGENLSDGLQPVFPSIHNV